MARKLKHQRHRSKKQSTSRRLTTWSRDENRPFSQEEYPFEQAVSAGEYSEILQMELGPGIILYPSTICLSRQDSHDATVLALMGEHFREFFPGEMPWLRKSAELMYDAMMINEQDQEDVEAFEDSLSYWAEQGIIEVDRSLPNVYRYRLHVDAVRTKKNAHFKPLNTLELIHRDYPRRFPSLEVQQVAFALICGKSRYLSVILLTVWHLGLRDTPRYKRHVDGRLNWLPEHRLLHYVSSQLVDKEKIQQALEKLRTMGLLSQRIQGSQREYRVHVENMWVALCALPEPLPEEEAMGGYTESDE